MDTLRSILIRPAVENGLSTLQVMGSMMMTQSSWLSVGKMSGAQMSNTSMRDGNSSPHAVAQLLIQYPQPRCHGNNSH